jgi:multidrug efflux pump subunit AcrA (membrane-fusion protein)
MAVKTTDFTKTRQRLDKPSVPEKPMNPERRPHRWIWVLGVLLLVVTAIGAGYLMNGSGNSGTAQNTNDDVVPGVVAYALIDNEKGVQKLHALGKVTWIIEEGAQVKKGAVLIKLDSTKELSQFKQADADYKHAENLVAKAKNAEKSHAHLIEQQNGAVKAAEELVKIAEQEYERAQEAKKFDQIVQQELKKAELNVGRSKILVEVEKAKLKALENQDPKLELKDAETNRDGKSAQLDAAKYALDLCELKAEEDGKVLRVQAHVGEWLTANAQAHAILFAPEGGLIARAEVLQEWADRVHVGQEVTIETEPRSQQQRWTSRVRYVSDMIGPKRHPQLEPFVLNDVRMLECVIDIPQGVSPQPRIFQRVRVMFKTGTK